MIIGLIVVLMFVLFLPFLLQIVERNLESFLFMMGLFATVISNVLNAELWLKALRDPIHISVAVLSASLFFKWFRTPIEQNIVHFSQRIPLRLFLGLVVIFLGLIASLITAIIAALVLVMFVVVLQLDRKSEVQFAILACFSIGLGAALTPIGEPLSTIATSKLNEGFFYLLSLIGSDVIPAILAFGILTILMIQPQKGCANAKAELQSESYMEIVIRTGHVYLFVMGLTLLGAAFEPLIERYLLGLSPYALYWINSISAILDNATLAAAEISPAMDEMTLKAILLGLLISGGMLIPGNIPNIITASKLSISSKEWARFGVPIGLMTMGIYFFIILFFS